MRLALQISGQQRYGDYLPQLLQAFDAYEVDIFVHNWVGPRDESELRKLIGGNVVDIKLEEQVQFVIPPEWKKIHWCGTTIFNLVSMTYGIREVNRMRQESGNQYDFVVRSRSDVRLVGFQPVSRMTDDIILVGNRPWYLPRERRELQDQFAFGTPAAMDKYCGLYDNLQRFHDEGREFHPETYFQWWVTTAGLEAIENYFDVQLEKIEVPREARAVY
jgi:hypothetical protein